MRNAPATAKMAKANLTSTSSIRENFMKTCNRMPEKVIRSDFFSGTVPHAICYFGGKDDDNDDEYIYEPSRDDEGEVRPSEDVEVDSDDSDKWGHW